MRQDSSRAAFLLLFAFLFLPYSYFNHSDGWNQLSRLAALHAVTIQGTIVIDDYHRLTGDKAFIDGHYYSEKAPTITVLAVPAFALTVLGQRIAGIDPDSAGAWVASQWISTAGSVGVIVALGGVAFFALLRPRLGDMTALMATAAVWLGTFVFPYATSLFSHAGTAGLLAIALWGVLGTPSSTRGDYLGGLAAGLAVGAEYPAVIVTGCLGLYLLTQDRVRAMRFGIGCLPGLALIAMNNFFITGSVTQLAYGSNANFPTEGVSHGYGHGLPRPDVGAALLVGQYRGLLFWNPVLLMAIPGLVALARADRRAALLVAGTFGLCLLQVMSFYNWHGGFAVGPRYLMTTIPALGLATAFGIARYPRIGASLAVVSCALMVIVTAVGIGPPEDLMTPLGDYYLFRVRHSVFAGNLGTLIGLPAFASFALLALLMSVLGWALVRRLGRSGASSATRPS